MWNPENSSRGFWDNTNRSTQRQQLDKGILEGEESYACSRHTERKTLYKADRQLTKPPSPVSFRGLGMFKCLKSPPPQFRLGKFRER